MITVEEYFKRKENKESDESIAMDLYISPARLSKWKKEHDILFKPKQVNLTKLRYLDHVNEGLTNIQIAKMYETSPSAITRLKYKWGLINGS